MTTTDVETQRVFRMETLTVLAPPFDGKVKLQPSWTKFPSEMRPNRQGPANQMLMEDLVAGQAYDFTFVRENQKNNTNGEMDFHYYWGIWSIEQAGQAAPAIPAQPQRPQNAPTAPTGGNTGQAALKQTPIDGMRWGNSLNVASAIATHFPDADFVDQVNKLMPLAAYLYTLTDDEIQGWAYVHQEQQKQPAPEQADEPLADILADAPTGQLTAVNMLGYDWQLENSGVWSCDDVIQDDGSIAKTTLGIHVADVVAAATMAETTSVIGEITARFKVPVPKLTPVMAESYIRAKGLAK